MKVSYNDKDNLILEAEDLKDATYLVRMKENGVTSELFAKNDDVLVLKLYVENC